MARTKLFGGKKKSESAKQEKYYFGVASTKERAQAVKADMEGEGRGKVIIKKTKDGKYGLIGFRKATTGGTKTPSGIKVADRLENFG